MGGARIVVVEGRDAGKAFDLSASTTIGREGDVVLDDSDVSRRHVSLSFDGSAVTVADLGSTNGTFVNEERVSAARPLEPGDRLRIGTTVFELRLPEQDDLDATRQRSAPDFASAPPASGAPGGGAGAPGGGPPPPSMPPPPSPGPL